MKLTNLTAILSMALCVIACNTTVRPNEIPGIYKANFPTKGIYIYILKGGTCKFQDSLRQKDNIRTATWKFNGRTLNVRMDDSGGIWPAEIENVSGKIRIVYAEEEGNYFDKIKGL